MLHALQCENYPGATKGGSRPNWEGIPSVEDHNVFYVLGTVDFKTIGEAGKIWKNKKIGSPPRKFLRDLSSSDFSSRNNFSSSEFSSSSDFNSSSNLSSSDFSSRNNINSNEFSSSSDLNNSSSDLSSDNSALLMTAMQCF